MEERRIIPYKPGDVISISGEKSFRYYIILGVTKFNPKKVKYPNFIVQKFCYINNGKYIGYHTKAFKDSYDKSLWYEGVTYLWDVKRVNVDIHPPIVKKAYEAVLPNCKFDQENFNRTQIQFFFDGNW